MLNEFISTLEDVANHPVITLTKGKFVKWDHITNPTRTLIAACPLTQVAIKAGMDMPGLQAADYPADYVVDFLKEHFDIDNERLSFVWNSYDNGTPILEIVARMELDLEAYYAD